MPATNATTKLHCLTFLRLHQLTGRGWAVWDNPVGARHPLLRSPRGSLFLLTLLPAARRTTPSPSTSAPPPRCTFLAEPFTPPRTHSDA